MFAWINDVTGHKSLAFTDPPQKVYFQNMNKIDELLSDGRRDPLEAFAEAAKLMNENNHLHVDQHDVYKRICELQGHDNITRAHEWDVRIKGKFEAFEKLMPFFHDHRRVLRELHSKTTEVEKRVEEERERRHHNHILHDREVAQHKAYNEKLAAHNEELRACHPFSFCYSSPTRDQVGLQYQETIIDTPDAHFETQLNGPQSFRYDFETHGLQHLNYQQVDPAKELTIPSVGGLGGGREMQLGMQPGMHLGMQPGMQTGMQPGMQPGMQHGLQPGIQHGMQSDISLAQGRQIGHAGEGLLGKRV